MGRKPVMGTTAGIIASLLGAALIVWGVFKALGFLDLSECLGDLQELGELAARNGLDQSETRILMRIGRAERSDNHKLVGTLFMEDAATVPVRETYDEWLLFAPLVNVRAA